MLKLNNTILLAILVFLSIDSFSQNNDAYYDFGADDEGITVYETPKLNKVEDMIITKINGSSKERAQFIKEDLLVDSGFRSTANIKYRKTTANEKTLSVLHGVFHSLLPSVPTKSFAEEEYGKLPDGKFYSFDTVIYASKLKDISVNVRACLELEYMLQVEFFNGILLENQNLNYYTAENINKFEKLALSLPNSPNDIKQLKDRYLQKELPKIKAAIERYMNPSELHLQAKKNLANSFYNNPPPNRLIFFEFRRLYLQISVFLSIFFNITL